MAMRLYFIILILRFIKIAFSNFVGLNIYLSTYYLLISYSSSRLIWHIIWLFGKLEKLYPVDEKGIKTDFFYFFSSSCGLLANLDLRLGL